jgi:ABC-type enterobactin transport system permease subunit
MARPLGLVAAASWAAWLLLKATTDQHYYVAHVAGFIAAFATAALVAYRAVQKEAMLGLGLVLGGAGMAAAGMAVEFIITLLPLKAGLDVALPWWFPNPAYVLFWGGVAAFAVGVAILLVEVSAEETFVKRDGGEEEKRKTMYFGGNKV